MPVITVQMLSGRTTAQKSALIAELAEVAKRTPSVPDEAIRILLTELPPEHWSIGSRTMADLHATRSGNSESR